jgi:hypothetical protein
MQHVYSHLSLTTSVLILFIITSWLFIAHHLFDIAFNENTDKINAKMLNHSFHNTLSVMELITEVPLI